MEGLKSQVDLKESISRLKKVGTERNVFTCYLRLQCLKVKSVYHKSLRESLEVDNNSSNPTGSNRATQRVFVGSYIAEMLLYILTQ